MSDLFHDFTFDVLTRSLDAGALNQTLISNNIANVDTPGYHRMEVSFKQQLKDLLEQSKNLDASALLKEIQPQIVQDNDTVMRTDGNNVDIDKEMAKLSANSIEYQQLSRLTAMKLTALRIAIEGR